MGRQSSKKKRGAQRRAEFRPDTIGYIEGLRLAAWMIEKTYGMVAMYRSENGISSPTPYSGPPIPRNDKETFWEYDERDPTSGHLGARLVTRALALELSLKHIAMIVHGNGKGALCTHNLMKLWLDIPSTTRKELETQLQAKVKVKKKVRGGDERTTICRPQTIESICSRNENVFVLARYISESKPQGEGELIQDKDIRGVLRFLSYWILKKMGHGIQWQPADDATVEMRYFPSEHPAR